MKKEETNIVSASLNGVRISPRKVRLVVDLIRSKNVKTALDILTYSSKKRISLILRKLLFSLLSNWKIKNNNESFKEEDFLYIKEIKVNQGKTLKRLRPVPQGRGHRIRKKSSNILISLEKQEKV